MIRIECLCTCEIAHRSTQAYEYYAHIHIDRQKETIRSSWRRLKDSQHCALCSRKSKHLPGSGQSVYHDAEFMLLRILLRDICIRKCIWQISLCRLMSGTLKYKKIYLYIVSVFKC